MWLEHGDCLPDQVTAKATVVVALGIACFKTSFTFCTHLVLEYLFLDATYGCLFTGLYGLVEQKRVSPTLEWLAEE